jgi:hypothetical protein
MLPSNLLATSSIVVFISRAFLPLGDRVVRITVEILFPYIPCFISFVASSNEANEAGTTQEGFLYLSYLSVSLSQRAAVDVDAGQLKHLRRSFAGRPRSIGKTF